VKAELKVVVFDLHRSQLPLKEVIINVFSHSLSLFQDVKNGIHQSFKTIAPFADPQI